MVRAARVLWIAWAVILWNVVFDYVIVMAGRAYVFAASTAVARGLPYVRMDDVMRPAATRALWMATASAAVVLAVGLTSVAVAAAGEACESPRIR